MPTTKNEIRLKEIEKQLAQYKEQYNIAKAERESSRKLVFRVKEINEEIQKLQHDATIAEKQTDYNKVAEIRYSKIPALENQLKKVEEELQVAKKDGKGLLNDIVQPEDIAGIIAKWTGIPASKLVQSEIIKLADLEKTLAERVVGQDEAITIVANAIRRARAGLKDPNRPIGSFLFLGPTGVGKTELAKALAMQLFNDEKAMIRIDMSEYMEKHTVSRLIGSPPGYIGHDEGGQLTETVRRKPYSVLLFDEVEKAHPDVFNVLLQLLDDGRLTDSKGRTVDFKNTIIILTSNIGSDLIMERLQNSSKTPKSKNKNSGGLTINELMPVLQKYFKPEFLNRLDDIIVFNPISQEILKSIVDIQLKKFVELIYEEKGITLKISKKVEELLGKKGRDPAFGARPLKRAIQRNLLDELAMEIIQGHINEGDTIKVDVKGEKVTFEK